MVNTQNTKNQHYVWRHYLQAWASDRFYCYRQSEEKLFLTKPKEIAREKYFYETQELTAGDLAFLREFINRATDDGLRELNRGYVEMTQLTFMLRRRLEDTEMSSDQRSEIENQLRLIEKNLGEKYHTGIENKCLGLLDSLRRAEANFYYETARCGEFLHFISLQYFRTARMQKVIQGIRTRIPGHDPRRTANILNHIHATNCGATLFLQRNAYRILFLRNESDIPFIAGDQPIVNMLDPLVTTDLKLFYPLSPSLAMVLAKDSMSPSVRSVSTLEVEPYNYEIYRMSDDQVYSNNESYLRKLVAIPKSVRG